MLPLQQIFFCCFFMSMCFSHAQQSYDPFQYGTAPNPIQAPSAPSLQQMRLQQQIQIQQQTNQQLMRMGVTIPPTQADIKAMQQMQLKGKAPALTQQQRVDKEMADLLQELQRNNSLVDKENYYNSPKYVSDVPNYAKAKNFIKEMLIGIKPLSVKDGYYFMEAAYGNLHLSYEEYNKLIASNASFIKQWLKENKYDVSNPEIMHFGIQKFLSDTLFITLAGKKKGHLPYYYDYIDALAKDDKRNYFVTKTLATGGGQCNTLPILYMILAEALNVEVSLGYNPQHTFIRYQNNKGTTVNYETTVDRFLPDQFYLETLPVMSKTQQNNIFINSLTKKKIVATLLFELAMNFVEEHWLSDKVFIKECMDIATPYFPNETYICISNYNLNKILYADAFNAKVRERGIKTMSEIEKYADVSEAYHIYYDYMDKAIKLGVQEIPEREFLQLMEYYDVKKKLQIAKKVDAKTKKYLFIN